VEQACRIALKYTPTPSFKSVQTILKSGQNIGNETKKEAIPEEHGFTRGAGYYGGQRGEQ